MKETITVQRGNSLQLKFDISHKPDCKHIKFTSSKYQCGAVYCQLQALSSRTSNNQVSTVDHHVVILVSFEKLFKTDNLPYTCQFSSVKLEKQHLKISEENTWHKIFEYSLCDVSTSNILTYSFDASFHSDVAPCAAPLATLYEDTETFDFNLCGEGGSVSVHKVVLKLASPVLLSMLSGEWKETVEGQITVADTTKETLEHFKDYIYLDKLPRVGVEQLLLIGSYLMMPDLVQKCVVRLLNQLDSHNILDIIEFAVKFKVTNLLMVLLNIVKKGVVSIDHLEEETITAMCEATNSTLNIK